MAKAPSDRAPRASKPSAKAPPTQQQQTDALKTTLRDAGLKWTASRAAVLEALGRSTSPLSHADVIDSIGDRGFDRATLYRNLMDLTEAGLVARTDLGDHVWRFEAKRKGGADHHPHFMCTSCGVVSCLPDESVALKPRAAGVGTVAEVLLKGECAACA